MLKMKPRPQAYALTFSSFSHTKWRHGNASLMMSLGGWRCEACLRVGILSDSVDLYLTAYLATTGFRIPICRRVQELVKSSQAARERKLGLDQRMISFWFPLWINALLISLFLGTQHFCSAQLIVYFHGSSQFPSQVGLINLSVALRLRCIGPDA